MNNHALSDLLREAQDRVRALQAERCDLQASLEVNRTHLSEAVRDVSEIVGEMKRADPR